MESSLDLHGKLVLPPENGEGKNWRLLIGQLDSDGGSLERVIAFGVQIRCLKSPTFAPPRFCHL